jgi:hypothetical protein
MPSTRWAPRPPVARPPPGAVRSCRAPPLERARRAAPFGRAPHAGRRRGAGASQAQARPHAASARRQGARRARAAPPCCPAVADEHTRRPSCPPLRRQLKSQPPLPFPPQYLDQLHSQLGALGAAPLAALARRGAAVALLLGPSPLRPKEAYLLRFVAAGGGGGGGGGGGCAHHAGALGGPGAGGMLRPRGPVVLRPRARSHGFGPRLARCAPASAGYVSASSRAPPHTSPRRQGPLRLRPSSRRGRCRRPASACCAA